MRFLSVGLRNYRNIELARLSLDAPRVFFVGENGQGKTNLLEAIGYITAQRAFRTRENRLLIGSHGADAELSFELEQEELGEVKARSLIKASGKEAWIDGQPARRVSDFVGQFPTVVLSSNDMQIARGSPGVRRRLLDNFLCGTSFEYFSALQSYQKAMQERNALLKKEAPAELLRVFERQMAGPALTLQRKRERAVGELREMAAQLYREIAMGMETLDFEYKPSQPAASEAEFLEALEKNRRRDLVLRSTNRGPHRDDLEISLSGRLASDFASEGQQRSTVLALALAIAHYWRGHFGFVPVALADDALAELDGKRRREFWRVLDDDMQVVATGTELPSDAAAGDWKVFEVAEGRVSPR